MLHLAAGSDSRVVQLRVEWSLPDDKKNPQSSLAQMCAIAAELVDIYSPFESARRPATFANLVTLANHVRRPAPPQRPGP